MKRAKFWAVAGALVLAGSVALAGDKTQSRKRAKDGSGDNCKLNAAVPVMVDTIDGKGTQSRKRAKDGSGDNCTAN
jgi:hypothetical protein